MEDTKLTDFWGNPALDYGEYIEMKRKYADNIFVTVSARPFGPCYVLYICSEREEDAAYDWLWKFHKSMKARKIFPYDAGVQWGLGVSARKAALL